MNVSGAGARQTPKDWTVLLYLNGQNDLEPHLVKNLLQAEQVGSTDRVDVVAQLARGDRERIGVDPEAPDLDGNWTGIRRYLVEPHPSRRPGSRRKLGSAPVETLPNADLGQPAALADFLAWGMRNYPAKRYMVVVGDHGKGFAGTGYDRLHRSHLDLGELKQAFEAAREQTGRAPDVLVFDACEMGALEVAYDLREQASFLVASEEIVGAPGLPHADILGWLTAHPGAGPRKVAEEVVRLAGDDESFRVEEGREDAAQHLAAVDLSRVQALREATDRLADALGGSSLPPRRLRELIEQTSHFNLDLPGTPESDFRDLGHFVRLLQEEVDDPRVRRAAREVQERLEAAVVANRAEGGDLEEAQGLSVYLPARPGLSAKARKEGYLELDFARDGRWDEFLTGRS